MLHYLANTALQLNLTFGRQNNLVRAIAIVLVLLLSLQQC